MAEVLRKIVIDGAIPFIRGVFEPFCEVLYKDGAEIAREDVLDADALITRTRTVCDSSLLEGTEVRIVSTATIGTDHINIEWCGNAGIEVRNAEGCNAGAVMQYVFAAIYEIASRKNMDLEGKTLGIIGAGHVGSKVEEMGMALGFKVLRCDPPREAKEGPEGFTSLEALLRESDIVTLHVPLDGTTKDMADAGFFSLMRPGAIFINASRGEVVVDEALMEAAPKLGGIVLDTWRGEPAINRKLLAAADIATPHIAGYSLQGKANGTAAAVRAVASRFGIEALYGFRPPVEGPLAFNPEGKTREEIAAEMIGYYPVSDDDRNLRLNPENFEKLRKEYNYRREICLQKKI